MTTTTESNIKSVFQTSPSFSSKGVPLPTENVDTDQIIPARFLKATNREGFGENLFRDWRYENGDESKPNPAFVLNNPSYKGKILVAGKNFGCGSSREHAAWALKDFGFEVIISSFFADIFKNNALNNFLLPIQLSPEFVGKLLEALKENPDLDIEVNLEEQIVGFSGGSESFEINPYKKMCLSKGLDDIEYLFSIKSEIEAFEREKNK